MSLNFWRETWWCWSMVETFLNTHMTRLSCSYEPAESHTPENWPCSSDVKVSVHLREKSAEAACVCVWVCALSVMFLWILMTALYCPCIPGPGRAAPLLQLPPALTLTGPPQGDKPQSPSQSERVTTLEESMRQLERGIQSGTLCFHFEVFKTQVGAKQWMGVLKYIYMLNQNNGCICLYFKQDLVCPAQLFRV